MSGASREAGSSAAQLAFQPSLASRARGREFDASEASDECKAPSEPIVQRARGREFDASEASNECKAVVITTMRPQRDDDPRPSMLGFAAHRLALWVCK
jgi:hypothetical protein